MPADSLDSRRVAAAQSELLAGGRVSAGPPDAPAGDSVETMWPEPVAVGDTVLFRTRPHRVVRATPRRVACDDPSIFGAHLDGYEGAIGALVGLVPLPAPTR